MLEDSNHSYDYSSSDDDCTTYGSNRRPSGDGASSTLTRHNSHSKLPRDYTTQVGGEVSGVRLPNFSGRSESSSVSDRTSNNHRYSSNARDTNDDGTWERHSLLGRADDSEYFTCKKSTCIKSMFVAIVIVVGLSGWATFTVFQLKPRHNYPPPFSASCSDWSSWGECSVTCGVGSQTRTRSCHGNSTEYWEADYHDSQGCTKPVCKASCTEWSPWGVCSVTCGLGSQSRLRKCQGNSSMYWEADYHDTQGCTQPICKARCDDWSSWGDCSVTCGQGSRVRNRKCYGNSSEYWESVFHDSEACTQPLCTGTWSTWSLWGACNVDCGCGLRSRNRTCSNEYCGTDYSEHLSCDKSCGPNDGRAVYDHTWIIYLVIIQLLNFCVRLF